MIISTFGTKEFKQQFTELRSQDDLYGVIIFKDNSAAFYRINEREVKEYYRDRSIPMVKQTFR